MYPCGHKQLPLRDLGFPHEISVPELLFFFFAFHVFAGLVPCAAEERRSDHRSVPPQRLRDGSSGRKELCWEVVRH